MIIIYKYTKDELAGALIDYYETYNKVPTVRDLIENIDYPTPSTFRKHFGSYNKALVYAGLPVNICLSLDKYPDVCKICESTKSIQWHHIGGMKICNKCYDKYRRINQGNTDPNSNNGISIIANHIVNKIHNDASIYVKSSKLYNNRWFFNLVVPAENHTRFLFICFDENKKEILKVFIIPIDSGVVKYGLSITNSKRSLDRLQKYEVDPTIYNDIYQNLDITTLPEFSNYTNNLN